MAPILMISFEIDVPLVLENLENRAKRMMSIREDFP
jgi:hypothetical protein